MLSRRSLRGRIVLAFLLLIVVFLGVAAQRVIDGERVDARAAVAREEIQGANDAARDLRAAVLERDRSTLLATSPTAPGHLGMSLEDATTRIEVLVAGFADHPRGDEGAVDAILAAEAAARTSFDEVAGRVAAGDLDAARAAYDAEAAAATADLLTHVASLIDAQDAQLLQLEEDLAAESAANSMLTVVVVLSVAGLAIVWGWWVARGIAVTVGVAASRVSEEAGGLVEVSAGLSRAANDTARLATDTASAGEEVSANVGSVAAATEETEASVGEIARSAEEATVVARDAVERVRAAAEGLGSLDRASEEIGRVVDVVTAIAEQTNLLALNATIEAARAGAAGKGFAVVAGEVKLLAQQTADATADITERVASIQSGTRSAHEAVAGITEVMDRIAELQATIAAAVEEQSASTGEVGRSMAQAADGAQGIAQGIAAVAATADRTTSRAEQVNATAARLSGVADDLDALVAGARAVASPPSSPTPPPSSGGSAAPSSQPVVTRDEAPVPVG